MPEPENDIYKEANDFTSECFQEIIDVLDNFIKDPFYEQFGQGATFPQVIMGDLKLGGCTESIMYLRAKGML